MRSSSGLGLLPLLAVLVFGLPLVWAYGPKLVGSPIDITASTKLAGFEFRSTEGPFVAQPGPGCTPGALASRFHAGDQFAWTSDISVSDAKMRVQTQIYMERLSDHAQLHTKTLPFEGRRDGVKSFCYQVPPDTAKGLYELHRMVHFYPETGADFDKQMPTIPFEVF